MLRESSTCKGSVVLEIARVGARSRNMKRNANGPLLGGIKYLTH
jgi:hypothetical protein